MMNYINIYDWDIFCGLYLSQYNYFFFLKIRNQHSAMSLWGVYCLCLFVYLQCFLSRFVLLYFNIHLLLVLGGIISDFFINVWKQTATSFEACDIAKDLSFYSYHLGIEIKRSRYNKMLEVQAIQLSMLYPLQFLFYHIVLFWLFDKFQAN